MCVCARGVGPPACRRVSTTTNHAVVRVAVLKDLVVADRHANRLGHHWHDIGTEALPEAEGGLERGPGPRDECRLCDVVRREVVSIREIQRTRVHVMCGRGRPRGARITVDLTGSVDRQNTVRA
jgi:hypothetical protein